MPLKCITRITSFDANKIYSNIINANTCKKMHFSDHLLTRTGGER